MIKRDFVQVFTLVEVKICSVIREFGRLIFCAINRRPTGGSINSISTISYDKGF